MPLTQLASSCVSYLIWIYAEKQIAEIGERSRLLRHIARKRVSYLPRMRKRRVFRREKRIRDYPAGGRQDKNAQIHARNKQNRASAYENINLALYSAEDPFAS